MDKADIGLIGLAVMGQNLVLNLERNGYTVAVYNRTTATMRGFVDEHPGKKLVATIFLPPETTGLFFWEGFSRKLKPGIQSFTLE